MAIITISRGSYSRGKEIAEKVAEKLGYSLLSRDILLQASEEFNIPEIRLVRALHDAPSVLDRPPAPSPSPGESRQRGREAGGPEPGRAHR